MNSYQCNSITPAGIISGRMFEMKNTYFAQEQYLLALHNSKRIYHAHGLHFNRRGNMILVWQTKLFAGVHQSRVVGFVYSWGGVENWRKWMWECWIDMQEGEA